MNKIKILKEISQSGRVKTFEPSGLTQLDFDNFDKLVELLIYLEQNELINKVTYIENHSSANRRYLKVTVVGGLTHKGELLSKRKNFRYLIFTLRIFGGFIFLYGLFFGIKWVVDPSGDYEPVFAVCTVIGPIISCFLPKLLKF